MGAARWWGAEMGRLALWLGGIRRLLSALLLLVTPPLAALETVDGVLEGIVRAKQDRKPIGSFSWLPILVHGDAAFAGQGVVVEVLQMSQLRGYRTGGTPWFIVIDPQDRVVFNDFHVDADGLVRQVAPGVDSASGEEPLA